MRIPVDAVGQRIEARDSAQSNGAIAQGNSAPERKNIGIIRKFTTHADRRSDQDPAFRLEADRQRQRQDDQTLQGGDGGPPGVRPSMIALRGTGATKVAFMNPNCRSQMTCMPLKIEVNTIVMPAMPGTRNWM